MFAVDGVVVVAAEAAVGAGVVGLGGAEDGLDEAQEEANADNHDDD